MYKVPSHFITCTLLLVGSFNLLTGQDPDRKIQFPDVDGYFTLKCDLHIHTVFSDGLVWPTIRIDEALRDGLDAISLTEHLEYQPWADDIAHPNRNRSYELALEYTKPYDLMIIHGAEITRDMPPGHANALFINDANKIDAEEAIDAYRNARAQGAFIFWNHSYWVNQQKDGLPVVTDFHQQLLDEDLLHGIEVVNDITISEAALDIAIDKNITALGTSDVHGLVDYTYELANGGHRPISLVLTKERSIESIKEALFAGRVVSWFENNLIGKEEHVRAVVDASLNYKSKGYIGDSDILQIEISNSSDARFLLKNTSIYDFYQQGELVEILPHAKKLFKILAKKAPGLNTPLTFDVLNAISGYKQVLDIEIQLSGL